MNEVRFDFAGTRVLVTGGTSGIGHAVAHAFAAAGAAVIVTGRGDDPDHYDVDLSAFAYRRLEISDPDSVDALVDELVGEQVGGRAGGTGGLDVLVNNAGATFPGGRDEWEPDTFARALAMNAAGPMRLTVGCRPLLAASTAPGGGCVINVVSMSAFRSVPIVPGYGSAKAALLTLTANLARQWVGDGIRVNTVAPGVIDTAMTAPMAAFPELLESELAHIPMGRMGTPDEVAASVLFLASGAATYVTGATLAIDGGYLLV